MLLYLVVYCYKQLLLFLSDSSLWDIAIIFWYVRLSSSVLVIISGLTVIGIVIGIVIGLVIILVIVVITLLSSVIYQFNAEEGKLSLIVQSCLMMKYRLLLLSFLKNVCWSCLVLYDSSDCCLLSLSLSMTTLNYNSKYVPGVSIIHSSYCWHSVFGLLLTRATLQSNIDIKP